MNRALLPLTLAVLLAGCQSQTNDTATTPAAQPEPTAAPVEAAPPRVPELSEVLFDVLAGAHRSEENRARDVFRNPAPTLTFFGLRPDMTVIEVNPGGGWYTEILGPVLNPHGLYVAAMVDPNIEGAPGWAARQAEAMAESIKAASDLYATSSINFYDPAAPSLGAPGSADLVLTFRNLHGWVNNGQAESMFKAFHEVLKPGGTLGVVQHRSAEDADVAETSRSGYLPEAFVVELAESVGFVLAERAEINANPRDSRDHARGVWSLPPTLAPDPDSEGVDEAELEARREARRAIGESDRMTLRFTKPAE